MSNIVRIPSVFALSVFALLIFFAVAVAPTYASAAEVSVQTAQVLPAGGNSCAPNTVSGFTPYVYGGSLHSFEFTISDDSYVAIAASAGSTDIPFNQMRRLVDSGGNLRIHVDMRTTPVGATGLPVSVTMLSAKGVGEPAVCISTVSVLIELLPGEMPHVTPPAPVPAPTPVTPPTATPPAPKPQPTPTSIVPPSKPATTSSTTGATPTATSVAFATTQNILKDMCTGTGAARLWFVLLALYVVIVAFAVFGQSQLPVSMRTQEWTAATIVVPFLLLFGLWYFAESCRTSPWVPVIATIIALAGLSVAFWSRSPEKSVQTVINLPQARK